MTAEEIVRALRCRGGEYEDCVGCTYDKEKTGHFCLNSEIQNDAADTIERLNDFEHSQCAKLLAHIAELESQLATSQQETRAAVECINGIEEALRFQRPSAAWLHIAEFKRGPQEAWKGEVE